MTVGDSLRSSGAPHHHRGITGRRGPRGLPGDLGAREGGIRGNRGRLGEARGREKLNACAGGRLASRRYRGRCSAAEAAKADERSALIRVIASLAKIRDRAV